MEKINPILWHLIDTIDKGKYPKEKYADIVKYIEINNDYLNELDERISGTLSSMEYEEAYDLAKRIASDKIYVSDMLAYFIGRYSQAKLEGLPGKFKGDEKLSESERETYQDAFCAPYSYLREAFRGKIRGIEQVCVNAKIDLDRQNELLRKFRDM